MRELHAMVPFKEYLEKKSVSSTAYLEELQAKVKSYDELRSMSSSLKKLCFVDLLAGRH